MMVDDRFSHLAPEAVRLLDSSVAARFSLIERDKVIETQRFQIGTGRMEDLYGHPRIGRPSNLLAYGPSGIGKSHMIDAVVARHPIRRNRATGELIIPIAQMEFPPDPDRRWFAKELALALGYHTALPRDSADVFALLLRRLHERAHPIDHLRRDRKSPQLPVPRGAGILWK